MITYIMKCGMKLLIHSQTSTVKFRNGWVIPSHTLLDISHTLPVPDEFPAQRPGTQSFDIFFDLRLNKGLSKQ